MFVLPWEDLTLTVLLLCFEKGDIEVLTLLRLFLGRHFATLGLKDCFASRERGLQDAWPLIVRCEIREGAKSDAKNSKSKCLAPLSREDSTAHESLNECQRISRSTMSK
jgi:hypothetical protein